MIPRGTWPALIPAAVVLALLVSLLSWGARGHRNADRQRTRADSLATEILLERARADGWEAVAADTAVQLLELLAASDSQAASLARELEAARARPVSRTVVVASSEGETTADLDPEASSPDSTIYRVDDGPLSGVITVWADSAAARLDWEIEISAELIHAEGPDRRGMVFARSTDPRVSLAVPELAWSPPPPPPGPSRLRWLVAGLAIGVVGWELVR